MKMACNDITQPPPAPSLAKAGEMSGCFCFKNCYTIAMKQELEIQSLRPLFVAGGVSYAGVFGSFARGEAVAGSDVDIFIRLEEPMSLLELVRFERELSQKIGREVDLVTEDALSPFMKDEVMHDMKTIYEKR